MQESKESEEMKRIGKTVMQIILTLVLVISSMFSSTTVKAEPVNKVDLSFQMVQFRPQRLVAVVEPVMFRSDR